MKKVLDQEQEQIKNDSKLVIERVRGFQYDMEDIEILKTTEGYGYEYTDLSTILKIISPVLKKHGIWYFHYNNYDPNVKLNTLKTVVYNVDDFKDCLISETLIDNEAVLGGMNRFQVEGSAITYFRRYHIVTLLGLTTEEDSDAAGKRKTKSQSNKQQATTSKNVSTGDNLDFVKFFTEMIESKKPLTKIQGVLNMYKEQINNEDLKTINNLIKEYENK